MNKNIKKQCRYTRRFPNTMVALSWDSVSLCSATVDQYCGVLSYGHQISGRIMLPLNLSADDGPIYVNAKQYHGIIRRRHSRAKAAVLLNKSPRSRKPYMHESRHLHAMRRPRGCGGRFLNTKNLKSVKEGSPEFNTNTNRASRSSHSSEVVQSENGNRSILSGSEVTSVYSTTNHRLTLFHMDHHIHGFTVMNMIDDRAVIPEAPNWMGAADRSCINLKA